LRAFGGPVVLIAGAGHTHYDWAVPGLFLQNLSKLSLVSVVFTEGEEAPEKTYDFRVATPGVEREDPCLAFQ
jgi:uncharacterized iron-regulated protein